MLDSLFPTGKYLRDANIAGITYVYFMRSVYFTKVKKKEEKRKRGKRTNKKKIYIITSSI